MAVDTYTQTEVAVKFFASWDAFRNETEWNLLQLEDSACNSHSMQGANAPQTPRAGATASTSSHTRQLSATRSSLRLPRPDTSLSGSATTSTAPSAELSLLKCLLPTLHGLYDEHTDLQGHALPPCMVMEKCESLQRWSARAQPDLFMSVCVRP